MDAMESIIKNLDWSPLFISLKTGIVATFISFFLGIYAARKVVKTTPGKKAVIDGILTLPMVLPPTVAGFFLLLIFSKEDIWNFLYETLILRSCSHGLVVLLQQTVIAFPLMYRNARAAFEQLDVNLIYAGRTLGMSDIRIFWKVVIPSAGPGIASGTILTFARALESTEQHLCWLEIFPERRERISQKIAMVIQDGDYATAGVWVAIVMLIAFLVIFSMNFISGTKMKNIKRW